MGAPCEGMPLSYSTLPLKFGFEFYASSRDAADARHDRSGVEKRFLMRFAGLLHLPSRIWRMPAYGSGHCSRKPFAEQDGELSFGERPFARRHRPFFFRSVQDQKEQFHRRFIGWKMPSSAYGPTQFGVQRFYSDRGVDEQIFT